MPKKIMIVDDEPDIRTTVGQVLEVSGYEVILAQSGKDCLEKLQKGIPDLVVLDIMMPEMSGWDVAAKIKENPLWNKIPIMFLTAKGDTMSMGMGSLTSEDYVVKPFDIIDLKGRIDKILHK
jgi:DNA-binding response OmpR family regulator